LNNPDKHGYSEQFRNIFARREHREKITIADRDGVHNVKQADYKASDEREETRPHILPVYIVLPEVLAAPKVVAARFRVVDGELRHYDDVCFVVHDFAGHLTIPELFDFFRNCGLSAANAR